MNILLIVFALCGTFFVTGLEEDDDLDDITIETDQEDDPSQWPGHLEPFGSKQKKIDIEVLDNWPSPQDFFKEFIDKSRPALFKGLAKRSPAYKLWDDEYLANHPGSDKEFVYCEPNKKENRTKEGKEVTLKNFIEIYHTESVYMVHGVPENIRKDVLMPPPLRCEETRKLMLDAVTWFSSGGTKSVLHLDDLDNVNCLLRGSKNLLFIDPSKYREYVPLDIKDGGYSSVDVDKVDYTKYPLLRNVDEYIQATMEEGDCLFIPFKWYHQVNSFPNEKNQNIAVNIWFKHATDHHPKVCDIPEDEATLDKYKFSELEKLKKQEERKEDPEAAQKFEDEETLLSVYEGYLEKTKKQRANFKTFFSLLKRDPYLTEYDLTGIKFTEHFERLAKELFQALDITQNKILNIKDFDLIHKEENHELYAHLVNEAHIKLAKYLESYIVPQKHDIPMKDEL